MSGIWHARREETGDRDKNGVCIFKGAFFIQGSKYEWLKFQELGQVSQKKFQAKGPVGSLQ